MSRPQSLKHLLVSGASGLIGSALVPSLAARGYRVSRLVRHRPGPGEIFWEPGSGKLDPAALEGIDGVIHLSGENLGKRWTPARRTRIRASRVESTRLLSRSIAGLQRQPAVMVSVSAIGIYGNRGEEEITEASPPGDARRDFLVSVVQEWEQAAGPARDEGIRVVHPRLGVVLSPAGGALRKMLLPFRLGVGGRLGKGSQWMSWISIDQVVEVFHHILIEERLEGPVNATTPEPVTNYEFTRTLARILRRPAILPVPELGLRLAFGEMAEGTILSSARVLPAKLLDSGFPFSRPDLESALRQVLGRERRDTFRA
jgi:uncharacterized protein